MYIFTIYQKPVPNKRTRSSNGRWYNPSHDDQESIRWQIKPFAPSEPLICPVIVDMVFYLPIPKNTSKAKSRMMEMGTLVPCKRPDIDNLAYLITNAMKGIYYVDDSQAVDMNLKKRYSQTPRTVVRVIEYNNEQIETNLIGIT